jgi:far upstream element-binding protein
MKIVNQHGNGPEQGNGNGQNNQNNNSFGGGGGGGSNNSSGSGGGGGGGGGNGGNYQPYQEIMVPGPKVGLVIGKGGETIKMLQEKTGAKMVVIQDGPAQELEKPLRISGDPQKVEHAKKLVYELIQDKADPQATFQRGGGPGGNGGNYNQGGEQAEVFVPKIAVGVVIGKGGDMIKKIQGETGCKLQFIQGRGDGPGDRRCLIQGTKQQVDDGRQMIEDLIDSITRRNDQNEMGGGNRNPGNGYNAGDYGQQQPMRDECTFSVPASKCGIIIGRGGDTIKQINSQSGAYCEMDRKTQNSGTEKSFIVKGTPEQIEHARSLISEKIGLEIKLIGGNGAPINSGGGYGMQSPSSNAYQQQWGYPQSWDQAQQPNPMQASQGAGQADYSQQWIEYYRSMGMHREAEMIEQQLKSKQTGQPPTSGPSVSGANTPNGQPGQPATTVAATQANQMHAAAQQPDYSAQWAEYYRSIGKIDEAEAIENQIKATKTTGAPQPGQIPSSGAVTMPTGGYTAAGAGAQGGGMVPGGYGGQYPQFYPGAGQPGYPGGYGAYGAYQGQQPQGGPPQQPSQQQTSNDKN